ncbi:uncharacterized protein LOC119551417 [Drosophila subpulchrella]|uniref:uncharacterized protein LOC119551417 n=1 Tax=Drosophila subpulchrella TaxID=1486046 RepID=UPI0018A1A007|nr:uncharacterized protein LOC119551417 [Drosophila subpulchrella]XP_037716686.1 uncharacterized protein LOC119551417 [Drosophila subpulchrella]XP_037716687.1 uncharacterized protein LOC119551417 [Drosophila subpulchrella]
MWLPGQNPLTGSINCYNSYDINCSSSSGSSSNCNNHPIAQYILRWPVINPLAFLMNDIRSKSFYRAGKATSAASASATTTTKSFDNSQNNNPRTYNNSGKSNKVFLHYIPRDPRLRIFNKTATLNKHSNRTLSELNITEDLCNYGELIGGSAETVKLVLVKS